jgi:hypothetical protein
MQSKTRLLVTRKPPIRDTIIIIIIILYKCTYTIENIKFDTLRKMRYYFDALFIIQVYLESKCRPSLYKAMVFKTLLSISNNLLCSIPALLVRSVFRLGSL